METDREDQSNLLKVYVKLKVLQLEAFMNFKYLNNCSCENSRVHN